MYPIFKGVWGLPRKSFEYLECGRSRLTLFDLTFFMPPRPRPAGGIERSGCAYVRMSVDQVNIFVQGRLSRPINGSKLIFHMSHNLMTYISRSIDFGLWPDYQG